MTSFVVKGVKKNGFFWPAVESIFLGESDMVYYL